MSSEKAYEAIEVARESGEIKKGANEVTKLLEKGKAKFVAYAADASPKEIIMHLPIIAKEKKIPCIEVDSKTQLGAAAGLPVATVAVAITKEGKAKKLIESIQG